MAESCSLKEWFANCGGWKPSHDLNALRTGISSGLLNEQDKHGMSALAFAVASGWLEGVNELLAAGADIELRSYRTGETALYTALQVKNDGIITSLIASGANPDSPNYWGITPRFWASRKGLSCFDQILVRETPLPAPHFQNAEHLADHHYPNFQIPDRSEREMMQIGQAVDLYVYGPKTETKQDAVKVRIISKTGYGAEVRYVGDVETPIERTHLHNSMTVVEFGPENIASVYLVKSI
ncbi:ankyrin repeat domain-containing protein [Lacunimicrobium album]